MIMIVAALMTLVSCQDDAGKMGGVGEQGNTTLLEGQLEVHFVDVGQGQRKLLFHYPIM